MVLRIYDITHPQDSRQQLPTTQKRKRPATTANQLRQVCPTQRAEADQTHPEGHLGDAPPTTATGAVEEEGVPHHFSVGSLDFK